MISCPRPIGGKQKENRQPNAPLTQADNLGALPVDVQGSWLARQREYDPIEGCANARGRNGHTLGVGQGIHRVSGEQRGE